MTLQNKRGSAVLTLVLVLLGSCSTKTKTDPANDWTLVEQEKPPSFDFWGLDLNDHGLIDIPSGTFTWQPTDTPIVVHTARRSRALYSNVSATRLDANRNAGLMLYYKMDGVFPGKDNFAREWRWLALDFPQMRLDGALHFFEVRAGGQNSRMPWDPRGPFLWKPAPGLTLYTNAPDVFWLYIEAEGGYGRATEFGMESFGRPPNAPKKWQALAEQCAVSGECPAKAYVWDPARDTIEVRDVYLEYVDLKGIDSGLPSLRMGEIGE